MKYFLTYQVLHTNDKYKKEMKTIPVEINETNKYFIITEENLDNNPSFFDRNHRFLSLRIIKSDLNKPFSSKTLEKVFPLGNYSFMKSVKEVPFSAVSLHDENHNGEDILNKYIQEYYDQKKKELENESELIKEAFQK